MFQNILLNFKRNIVWSITNWNVDPSRATKPNIKRPFRQTTCCVCSQLSVNQRNNCNKASVSRIKKAHYVQTYPTQLVFPDGSSISIRYEKPRRIIKLPVDASKLTDVEKEQRKLILNPPKKIKVEEETENLYDTSTYVNMLKKKRK